MSRYSEQWQVGEPGEQGNALIEHCYCIHDIVLTNAKTHNLITVC